MTQRPETHAQAALAQIAYDMVQHVGTGNRVNRILRRPEVETRTGLGRSTIYAMIAEGTFPKPIRLGKRAVGWPESAISEWLESRTSDAA